MKDHVVLGIEILARDPLALAGKRVAVLSHQAAVTHDFHRSVDIIADIADLVRIFAPEHGFWGVKQAMQVAEAEIDRATGKEIVSLYAEHPIRPRERTPNGIQAWKMEMLRRKGELWPKQSQLEDVDVLVVDLQDVGARYYTFATTMAYCMEIAKITGTRVVVCDRPNPVNGVKVEGNLFDDPQWFSFVGQFDIAPRHGMTIGELARLFRATDPKYACDLDVITMEGWRREMWWDNTDLVWIPPSPNLPSLATATVYAGMCLLEATAASEGRGTTIPFEIFGAPMVDPVVLAGRLNSLCLAGVVFRPQYFEPTFQKHAGSVCGGVQLHVTDREIFNSYQTGLWCTKLIHDTWTDFEWRRDAYEYEPPDERHALEQLIGSIRFREVVESGGNLGAWISSWDGSAFERRRAEALLYS
jgi:uncharacterized protein YbbC (DUF1343 family)